MSKDLNNNCGFDKGWNGYAQRVMVQQVFEKYGISNPFGEATEN